MKIFDNITEIVRDDLRVTIEKGSRVSVAAAYFSMYAFNELKKQLESIKEFRFIFTSPTFIREKAEKQKREFYIPRLSREKGIYGTEFEIKLRNEMTQKAIAKECADWIRRKARFKSNTTGENMGGFMPVASPDEDAAFLQNRPCAAGWGSTSCGLTATCTITSSMIPIMKRSLPQSWIRIPMWQFM